MDKGKLPPTPFHQIEGGSENANLVILAMSFLLVVKGLTQRVVLTRLPPGHTTRRRITVDPFTAGARAYTVACADKMERSYLDEKPELAAEWVEFLDEAVPQSDNAIDNIAKHPLPIPFQDVLFVGGGTSDHEINPRNRGSRCRANGDTLPNMRVVRSPSSVLYSCTNGGGDRRRRTCVSSEFFSQSAY